MFAKIYDQIFDSSIAEDWQTRHVFEDMLKMCDREGILDKTPEAIARRANIPLDIVQRAILELEKPDPRSRNPEFEGRRIKRLDDHRDWGWRIVNYTRYRQIASEDQRRENTLSRVRHFREKLKLPTSPGNAPVTPGNAVKRPVTPGNACNAMQMQMQRHNDNIGYPKLFMGCQRVHRLNPRRRR